MSLRALFTAAACFALAGCLGGEAATGDEQFQKSAPPRAWEAAPVREGNLRVATFNIRNFPTPPASMTEGTEPVGTGGAAPAPVEAPRSLSETDREMLLDVLEELAFDVLAVQEIVEPAALDEVLVALGERTGATYQSAYSQNLVSGNEQQVGIIVRADRLRLEDAREHAEIDVRGTLRAGLSARVVSQREGGADLSVLALHLASGDSAKRATLRADQAKVTSAVVAGLVTERADDDVIVLGDLNTAREEAEYGALDAAFSAELPFERLENETGCTSYYVKNKLGHLHASTIDQVYVASLAELDREVPLTAGAHCYERSCAMFESDSAETGTSYWGVSDHCPVYFEVRDADVD